MHTSETIRDEASPKGTRLTSERLTSWLWLLLAAAWRLDDLGRQPLWWDEGWSVYFAVARVPEMLRLTAVDIHPPLYYLLLHGWTLLFGPSATSVRLMSFLIGMAALPLMYLAGRRLGGHRLGQVAVFLLGISPFHIYYSLEVRMYGLVMLAGLGAFYFALAWRQAGRGAADVASSLGGDPPRASPGAATWVGYVVSAAAALYTQYYAAFLLLALNLLVVGGWWRRRPSRRAVGSWLGAQAAAVALFLPWLWYAAPKLLTYVRYKVSVEQDVPLGPLTYLARHLAAFQWGHAEGALAGWWWLGLVPLGMLILALWLVRRDRPWRGQVATMAWPLGVVVVTLVCGFVVNLILPFNPPRLERMLLLALPAYLLVVALMIEWLVSEVGQQRSRAQDVLAIAAGVSWVIAAFVSLFFLHTVPRYPDDDYRPVAAQVAALSTPDDAIVCVHPWQVGYFTAYLPQEDRRPTLVLTPREAFAREEQLWAADRARMVADLYALLEKHGRVWLADHQAMGRVLEDQIEDELLSEAYPVLRERHGKNTILSLFAAGAPVRADVDARLGDWLALRGSAFSPGPLPAASGVVPVELYWQVLTRPEGDYRIGLRLMGPTGHVWAQRDTAPLAGLWPFTVMPVGDQMLDRHGLLVPAGTPPGEYRLTVRVYDASDLSVLPATFAGGSGGEVTLGTVRVTRPETAPPVEALSYGPIVTPTQELDVDYGSLLLVGAGVAAPNRLSPGEAVDVTLFWRAVTAPGQDYLPTLSLIGPEGEAVAELQEKPVAGTYPTAWWQAGELVRDPHTLYVPARAGPGEYQLAVRLVRAADGQVVGDGRNAGTVLGRVVVAGRDHVYTPPEPGYVQQAAVGGQVELSGYDVAGLPAERGGELQVVLYWHPRQTPDRPYQAFVHLLDARGEIVAQSDSVPGEGERPTLGWLPGEYVADRHTVPLPADLPRVTYRLEVGLYEPVSGYRPGAPILLDTPVLVGP